MFITAAPEDIMRTLIEFLPKGSEVFEKGDSEKGMLFRSETEMTREEIKESLSGQGLVVDREKYQIWLGMP